MMWVLVGGVMFTLAIVTLPIWGMGAAVFLDSDRSILSREVSPDGSRIAQVERLVVGGVPNIVVVIRASWLPDWYLAGCAATSHYGETRAAVRWITNNEIEVSSAGGRQFWSSNSAPFHHGACDDVRVKLANSAD
jgi:hypothetical protein